jgi:hypothetical protein
MRHIKTFLLSIALLAVIPSQLLFAQGEIFGSLIDPNGAKSGCNSG